MNICIFGTITHNLISTHILPPSIFKHIHLWTFWHQNYSYNPRPNWPGPWDAQNVYGTVHAGGSERQTANTVQYSIDIFVCLYFLPMHAAYYLKINTLWSRRAAMVNYCTILQMYWTLIPFFYVLYFLYNTIIILVRKSTNCDKLHALSIGFCPISKV